MKRKKEEKEIEKGEKLMEEMAKLEKGKKAKEKGGNK